ncbi:MAG: hypothetical protein IKI43_06745, partial [Campylobacter sp.]|nr:hypothetical protein [Campylobacter sp.]
FRLFFESFVYASLRRATKPVSFVHFAHNSKNSSKILVKNFSKLNEICKFCIFKFANSSKFL